MAVAPLGVVAVRRGVAVVGSLQGDAVDFLREGVVGLLQGVAAVAFLVGEVLAAVGLRQEAGGEVSLRVGGAVGVIERGCIFSLGENKIFSIDGLLHVFLISCFFLVDVVYITKTELFLYH